MSHDLLIFRRLRIERSQIIVGFGLFLGCFKRTVNLKGELIIELCYTGMDPKEF